MFQFRPEQMKAFDNKASQLFENEMWEHVQSFAPKLCDIVKEDGIRTVIRHGIQLAESYGFTNRGPVRFVIELVFSFGCHFDSDPQHIWAQQYLLGKADQTYRADKLFEAYQAFAEGCLGENNSKLRNALTRIQDIDPVSLVSDAGDVEQEIASAFKALYPERLDRIGQASTTKLIESAISTANTYHATATSSRVISTGLAFLIGHRYDRDLLYPWISKALNSTPGVDPDQRFLNVHKKAMIYADDVLGYWEGQ